MVINPVFLIVKAIRLPRGEYPVLLDDGLADDYEVLVFPTSVVIDRNGRVRYRVEGFREKSFRDLERVVERLLAET